MAQTSGKRVVLVIAAMALAAVSAGLWYHYETGHQPVEFWGREPALLIAQAPKAELLRIAPLSEVKDGSPDEILRLSGDSWAVLERCDVIAARGFGNVRRALVESGAFDWSTKPNNPVWRLAIRFQLEPGQAPSGADNRPATVLFAPDTRAVGLAETGASASLAPEFIKVLQNFANENFGKK